MKMKAIHLCSWLANGGVMQLAKINESKRLWLIRNGRKQ